MSAKNCNQCEKVFTTSSSLSHHKRTHNKLNIVTCEFCGFQFTSNGVVEAMHQYLDKRMRIGNYTVKNLESEAHGKKN